MKEFQDENNQVHFATDPISRDAAGALFSTKNDRILIKDYEGNTAFPRPFDNPCYFPLADMAQLVLPMQYLKPPDCGYVLEIPEGFIPLGSLFCAGLGDEAWVLYAAGGGLRRRLKIILNTARFLNELHCIPAHYGPLSPDKIYVSSDPQDACVVFLYTETISCEMDFKPVAEDLPYYPKKAAGFPGKGTVADIYSFAALAGDLLTNNGAFSGVCPELEALLKKAAQDENYPYETPKISTITQAVIQALDNTITCAACKKEYVYREEGCPHCGAQHPKIFVGEIYDRISNTVIQHGTKIFEFKMEKQHFLNYHTQPVLNTAKIHKSIEFILKVSEDKKLHMVFTNLIEQPIKINNYDLHTGESHDIALPCKKIEIAIPIHSKTTRAIDIVIK